MGDYLPEGKNMFNIEAEVNVLGAIIRNNDYFCEVFDALIPEDFYRTSHKIIYGIMMSMFEKNMPIDITTLVESLGSRVAEIVGITYLSEIIASAFIPDNILAYAQIIKEKAEMRRVYSVLKKSLTKLNEENMSSDKLKEFVDMEFSRLICACGKDDGDIKTVIENYVEELEKRYKNGGRIQGVKCGYRVLDRNLSGFNKQDFIVLAARPSMGKTAVALNIALNMTLKENVSTAFFSLEMGKQQLLERIIAAEGSVPLRNLKNGKIEDNQWAEILAKGDKLYNSKLKLYDKIFTLRGIRGECKKLKIQQNLDVVIIDYLQLIDSGEKLQNRTQYISNVSRSLKLLAKELDVIVIALSQLSRAPETRMDHRPVLSDLRESGSIEQDADVVVLLYRDEYYHPDTEEKGILDFIIAKHRNGRVGTVKLNWIPDYQRVEERKARN